MQQITTITTTTTISAAAFSPRPPPALRGEARRAGTCAKRRDVLALTALAAAVAEAKAMPKPKPKPKAVAQIPDEDEEEGGSNNNNNLTIITDRVYMDITAGRGDEAQALGRMIIGLYGRHVPRTVANFRAMCTAGAYAGTPVHRVLAGQYFMAGRQGRGGLPPATVAATAGVTSNQEVVQASAFTLRHRRPGTVSLCVGENDDDAVAKLAPAYHNVEFLVTTGPGPCPRLDGANIVFGTVLQGLDVVTAITSVPTYQPGEQIKQLNDLAEFLKDERAQNARNLWNRPLKSIFISSCGQYPDLKRSMTPMLQ